MASTEWMDNAACREVDGELFFPAKQGDRYQDAARAVCAVCPVAATCLDYALERSGLDGVWGGSTPRQRTSIRQAGIVGSKVKRAAILADLERRREKREAS